MPEPKIEINGMRLSDGQAMTVRVAIEHFASCLAEHGLGDDRDGKAMCDGYLRQISALRNIIFSEPAKETVNSRGGFRFNRL